eukprot:CAMPEP_0174375908 /NCGR_PEP_ID=MMETSP0811_2-20130205/116241_1 /TAXON_ID=73025 ORGANISM="Eutreptiella gymnastica-like, Strain CCMP1594" /NCGR_SAMPLE_ID=MMETSP0811_2 /ASSEMBLY_ACC=CAM_ASM_000667 /LENGTH=63 /DNA_ID=CAMNT_0015526597 /DNA_START=491 /DNA_END=682 /DNA_ORIENTATION=-
MVHKAQVHKKDTCMQMHMRVAEHEKATSCLMLPQDAPTIRFEAEQCPKNEAHKTTRHLASGHA